MVEEERPVCKVEMMNDNHEKCDHKNYNKGCKKVLVCHLATKNMSKVVPVTMCEDISIGEEEICTDMVKLRKEKHQKKYCAFHPNTVCKEVVGQECQMVKKKMCNYIQNNQ